MPTATRTPRRLAALAVLGGLLLAGIAVALVAATRHRAFEEWLALDRDTLAPYPIVLHPPRGPAPEPALDQALVAGLSEGRLVTGISRSEYRRSALGGAAWAKVHLTTALPQDANTHVRIKLLARLHRDGAAWRLRETRELVLP